MKGRIKILSCRVMSNFLCRRETGALDRLKKIMPLWARYRLLGTHFLCAVQTSFVKIKINKNRNMKLDLEVCKCKAMYLTG